MNESKKRKLSSSASISTSKKTELFHFNPHNFLRAHSRNDSTKDKTTQLWDVVFEPNTENPGRYLPMVATCGGNTICVTNLKTGEVLLKYVHKDIREEFYSLAYTTFSSDTGRWNCLVSGSAKGEIRFFHPKHQVCFYEMKASTVNPEHQTRPDLSVNSILFHPTKPAWLITVLSNKYVTIWDIGTPRLPNYDGINPKPLFTFKTDVKVQNQAAFTNDWLLVASGQGVLGWHVDVEKLENNTYNPITYQFQHPNVQKGLHDPTFVECLSVFSDWKVVSKCAMHGKIYIWDLKATLENAGFTPEDSNDRPGKVQKVEISMVATLNYTESTEYYMNLGCLKGMGVVVCGDDKGMIWLYDMRSLVNETTKPKKEIVKETAKLPWPMLLLPDPEKTPKKSKEGRGSKDVKGSESLDDPDDAKKPHIINRTIISDDFEHIIGITNRNMICIWKQSSE